MSLATGSVAYYQDNLKIITAFGVTAALALCFAAAAAQGKIPVRLNAVLGAYGVCFAAACVSLIWSRSTYDTLIYLCVWVVCGVWLFLVSNIMTDEGPYRWLHVTVAILAIVLALIAFLEYFGLVVPYGADSGPRPKATMGNTDYLGVFLMLALPFCYSLIVRPDCYPLLRARRPRVPPLSLGVPATAAAAATLALTLCRSAWAGAVASVVVYAVALPRRHPQDARSRGWVRVVLGAGVVLAAVVVAFVVVPGVRMRVAESVQLAFSDIRGLLAMGGSDPYLAVPSAPLRPVRPRHGELLRAGVHQLPARLSVGG